MASTVWKGHLTFGLLSLPVKLHSAARRESVSFNMLHKSDNSRMKQVLMCQADDCIVPRSEIVKGYEYEKDKYIVVTDEEIESVAPKTKRTVQVLEFVKAADVDPVYLDSSYYIAPDAAGAERVYALLYKALRESGYMGIAKITMHNSENVVAVRAGKDGLLMHTLYYADEIRQVEEFRTDCDDVKENELALTLKLVHSMASKYEPAKYKDEYRANMMSMIAAKVQGKEIEKPAQSTHLAPVIDILQALKASVNGKGSEGNPPRFSESPHEDARRRTPPEGRGIGAVGRANGAQEATQRAAGDPLSRTRARGSRPRTPAAGALGTPKRS